MRNGFTRLWVAVLLLAPAPPVRSAPAEAPGGVGAAPRPAAADELLRPSLVTLRFKDAPPKQVFAELARQSGWDLRTSPPDLWERRDWPLPPSVSIDVRRRPFWVVMQELCSEAGVQPRDDVYHPGLSLEPAPFAVPWFLPGGPSVVSGPFLIAVAEREVGDDPEPPAGGDWYANFTLGVLAEPRLHVVGMSEYIELLHAEDDRGNRLVSELDDETLQSQGSSSAVTTQLLGLARGAERVAKLRGRFRVLIQTQAERIEVADFLNAHNVTKAVAGRRYEVRGVKELERGYEINFAVSRDGLDERFWATSGREEYGLRLLDAGGKALDIGYSATTRRGEGREGTFRVYGDDERDPAGPPVKLVWDVPAETREIEVPFELTNIPLQ